MLFDCWKQCLEVLILSPESLKLAGVDFVTSILRLIVDKVVNTQRSSESFTRLAAETTMTLCGVLNVFKEELSETMLNLILNYLCSWTADEASAKVRSLLYPSILTILKMIKDQKKKVANRSGFAMLVEGLCKDTLHSNDVGKMLSMYLLGEIIHWSLVSGLGGKPADSRTFYSQTLPKILPTLPSEVTTRMDESTMSEDGGPEVSLLDRGECAEVKGFDDISSIHYPIKAGPAGDRKNGWFPVYTPPSSPRTGLDPIKKDYPTMAFEQLHSTAYRQPQPKKKEKGKEKPAETFTMLQQENLNKSVASFQANGQESFDVGTNFPTQSTVMDYMHNKGLLRHLIDALPLVDDKNLLELFCKTPGTVHMRSLLLFEAKMYLFSRFSNTSPSATLILVEDNLIMRLADMHVFNLGAYLSKENPLNESEMALLMEHPIPVEGFAVSLTQQASQMESLMTSVLGLFHSMVSSAPLNFDIVAQVSFVKYCLAVKC